MVLPLAEQFEMNAFLKVLVAVALIGITIAAGTYVLKGLSGNQSAARGDGKSEQDAIKEPRVVSTSQPPNTTTQPIVIKPDNPLQPSYRPINQPEYIQFLRQEGKIYHSKVVGRVSGQASKKDWGIRGVAYFTYIYAVKSDGKIVKNDGVTIIEERSFGRVNENLIVSGYELRVELPEKIGSAFQALDEIGKAVGGETGDAIRGAGRAGDAIAEIVNNVQIPVTQEWVEFARQLGLFTVLPNIDPAQFEREIKMFTQGRDNKLLEGKTAQIVFKDGYGVSEIIPINCEISDRERDIIVRTNFVMDHYLFPNRKVEPGADWSIDGSVFAGFLDPRLNGKVSGQVTVTRTPDFVDAVGRVSKKLKLTKGDVVVREETGSSNITGQLTGLGGVCVLPDDYGVVTSAHLHGYAEYKNVSRDHLLFDAQTTVQPKIEVRYDCTVE